MPVEWHEFFEGFENGDSCPVTDIVVGSKTQFCQSDPETKF
jgi:hypothetical protein